MDAPENNSPESAPHRRTFLRRLALPAISAILAALIAWPWGWSVGYGQAKRQHHRTIAVKWGDSKYGPAFYGAYIYTVPDATGYAVHAKILIRPHDGGISEYLHDCGQIGHRPTRAEAVADFSAIRWTPAGLHIGKGDPNDYFLPRAQLESHR